MIIIILSPDLSPFPVKFSDEVMAKVTAEEVVTEVAVEEVVSICLSHLLDKY